MGILGIRRETKSSWERRVPITPELTRHLVHDCELDIIVQPSSRRVFTDKEYIRAGANVTEDLSRASIIIGVKEVPEDLLQADTAYMFFSHVIKGQAYNMGMLKKIMDLGCTLIDYEKVRDENDRRLIFFGRFAGLAGMIDSLWCLGQRLMVEGIASPFSDIRPSHKYESLAEAQDAIKRAGEKIIKDGLPEELTPLIIGITGYGNVAQGVREILADLPIREIAPADVKGLALDSGYSRHAVYEVTFREGDLVVPIQDGASFELQDYYDHPERYRSIFASYLPHLDVVMNCNYWAEQYPRIITNDDLSQLFFGDARPKLRVIGDLACDIGGSVECTVRCTEPGDPVFVWDVNTQEAPSGFAGHGPVVLAVDILPAELPRESSQEFSNTLQHFVPYLTKADFSVSFADLDLPPELKRAVIVHRGELTPDFEYIEAFLQP